MGKSDRAVVFGALGLWIGISAPVPDAFVWVMPLVDALLVLTIVNRVRAGLREASAAASPPC
jgi:CDP-diacylglycerol--glycerol-3-phosphate 3-phosphatidyltransferase